MSRGSSGRTWCCTLVSAHLIYTGPLLWYNVSQSGIDFRMENIFSFVLLFKNPQKSSCRLCVVEKLHAQENIERCGMAARLPDYLLSHSLQNILVKKCLKCVK